tara:strand:+ start:108 stop:266 length:159 start_codon:yes stop_codon:yes gene_type:complete
MSKKYWKFFAEKSAGENNKLKEQKKYFLSQYRILLIGFVLISVIALYYAYFV